MGINKNFADWELTCLLPINTTHRFLIRNDNTIHELELSTFLNPSVYKVAWGWEDIRLYLESKGYYLGRGVNTFDVNFNIINVWYYDKEHEPYQVKVFIRSTYEETRKEAIKYCLNLINNE